MGCTVKNESATGKCYGFVKFSTPAAASRAVDGLAGHSEWIVKPANSDSGAGNWFGGGKGGADMWMWEFLFGWSQPSRKSDDREERPEGPPSTNLYVKDLPIGITEDQVMSLFSQVGQVEECRVLWRDSMSPGAALVRMTTLDQANRAKADI